MITHGTLISKFLSDTYAYASAIDESSELLKLIISSSSAGSQTELLLNFAYAATSQAIPYISLFLLSETKQVRDAAAYAIGECILDPDNAKFVISLLCGGDTATVASVMSAILLQVRRPVLASLCFLPIVNLIAHSDRDVRQQAALLVLHMPNDAVSTSLQCASDILLDLAIKYKSYFADSLELILSILTSPSSPVSIPYPYKIEDATSLKIAFAIAAFRQGFQGVAVLDQFCSDVIPDVRCVAIRALGVLLHYSSILHIKAGLTDPDPEVQFHAGIVLSIFHAKREDFWTLDSTESQEITT